MEEDEGGGNAWTRTMVDRDRSRYREPSGRGYSESLKMALESCEPTGDQFKLIETPINSFILITNVLPDDSRRWDERRAIGWGEGEDETEVHATIFDLPEDDAEGGDDVYPGGVGVYSDCLSGDELETPVAGSPYLVFEEKAWIRALILNKDEILTEALELVMDSQNWRLPELIDPLPCFWMVFHGRRSFCESSDCLYRLRFGVAGPVLFPAHMYCPSEDLASFVIGACRYFRCLYTGCDFSPSDYPGLPFDPRRAKECLRALEGLEPPSCAYLSRLCLLCHLYRQNRDVNCSSGQRLGCLILGGVGSELLGEGFNSGRDLLSGDAIIAPRYNLEALLSGLDANGRFRKGD